MLRSPNPWGFPWRGIRCDRWHLAWSVTAHQSGWQHGTLSKIWSTRRIKHPQASAVWLLLSDSLDCPMEERARKLADGAPGHECPEYDGDDEKHHIHVDQSISITDGQPVIELEARCKCGWNASRIID